MQGGWGPEGQRSPEGWLGAQRSGGAQRAGWGPASRGSPEGWLGPRGPKEPRGLADSASCTGSLSSGASTLFLAKNKRPRLHSETSASSGKHAPLSGDVYSKKSLCQRISGMALQLGTAWNHERAVRRASAHSEVSVRPCVPFVHAASMKQLQLLHNTMTPHRLPECVFMAYKDNDRRLLWASLDTFSWMSARPRMLDWNRFASSLRSQSPAFPTRFPDHKWTFRSRYLGHGEPLASNSAWMHAGASSSERSSTFRRRLCGRTA